MNPEIPFIIDDEIKELKSKKKKEAFKKMLPPDPWNYPDRGFLSEYHKQQRGIL